VQLLGLVQQISEVSATLDVNGRQIAAASEDLSRRESSRSAAIRRNDFAHHFVAASATSSASSTRLHSSDSRQNAERVEPSAPRPDRSLQRRPRLH
jgi:hypothetical protein